MRLYLVAFHEARVSPRVKLPNGMENNLKFQILGKRDDLERLTQNFGNKFFDNFRFIRFYT